MILIRPAKRHMKTKRTSTDGLGGFYDASQTLSIGAVKRIRCHRFYFFLTLIFLTWFPSPDAYDISCLSLSLSVQSCNETYKRINFRHHCSRKILIPTRNKLLTKTCIIGLLLACLFLWLLNLILLCGDVHPNPGPPSTSTASESSLSSLESQASSSNHLSIFHLNVQSLLPKIDLIRAESEAYDIAVYTERWLKPSTSNDDISIENFLPPFRTDRPDRPGGGVVIYVQDTILCKRR